ncbi:hypothetical protein D3C81_1711770 [compost metagenome]
MPPALFRLPAPRLRLPLLTSAPSPWLSRVPLRVSVSAPLRLESVPPVLLSRLAALTTRACQPESRPWLALRRALAFRSSWPALMIRPASPLSRVPLAFRTKP